MGKGVRGHHGVVRGPAALIVGPPHGLLVLPGLEHLPGLEVLHVGTREVTDEHPQRAVATLRGREGLAKKPWAMKNASK